MNEEIKWENFYKEEIDEQDVHTLVAPPVNDGNHFNVNRDLAWLEAHGFTEWTDEEIAAWHAEHDPVPVVTVQDYDNALEDHLRQEREARGYTTREPDYYFNSSVPRWKQDALDWVAHRDAVMLYGLQVENDYEAGKEVPTLDEFRADLPVIQWTLQLTEE